MTDIASVDSSNLVTPVDDSNLVTPVDDSGTITTSSSTSSDLLATSAFLLAFGANLQTLSILPDADHKAVVNAAVGAFVSTL